jgi:hypothetical protein
MMLLTKISAHVLEDLLPYVCIIHDCQRSTIPFDTRALWLNHLKAKHETTLAKSGLACTLCAEIITGDHRARVAHVERHLIEIALSILPTGEDHDTENPPPRLSCSPPTGPELEEDNNERLVFITSGSPADFTSKKTMASVRKRAMSSALNMQYTNYETQSQASEALAGTLSSADSTSHHDTFESDEDSALRAEVGVELSEKQFPCLLRYYGCNASYSSRDEWKRHHVTQHIELGIWRCFLCGESSDPDEPAVMSYNDFNRKGLFTQHLRRIHMAPHNGSRPSEESLVNEGNLATHHERCFISLRELPDEVTCAACDTGFIGPHCWNDFMEHVASHFEDPDISSRKKTRPAQGDWVLIRETVPDVANTRNTYARPAFRCDPRLEEYLIREGLIVQKDNGTWAIGNGNPLRNSISDADNQTTSRPFDETIGAV